MSIGGAHEMGVPSNQITCASQNNHYPKKTARTSSDFGAQRRNCTEMGTIFNQNSYYIPAPSKRISVLFGSFVAKSLDDPVHTRWVPHQSRYSITRTPLSSTSKYRLPLNHSPKLIYLDFLLESNISNAKCRWPKIK